MRSWRRGAGPGKPGPAFPGASKGPSGPIGQGAIKGCGAIFTSVSSTWGGSSTTLSVNPSKEHAVATGATVVRLIREWSADRGHIIVIEGRTHTQFRGAYGDLGPKGFSGRQECYCFDTLPWDDVCAFMNAASTSLSGDRSLT